MCDVKHALPLSAKKEFSSFSFCVSYAFIRWLIHSFIYSFGDIHFVSLLLRSAFAFAHTQTHTHRLHDQKPQCTRPQNPLKFPFYLLPSRVESFGLLFRVLPSSFCQVFPLLPFVVN